MVSAGELETKTGASGRTLYRWVEDRESSYVEKRVRQGYTQTRSATAQEIQDPRRKHTPEASTPTH